MESDYDEQVARHYRAYRPELHQKILAGLLPENASYSKGLDIGCGTGRSSLALAAYCKKVIGIDPVPEMLQQAEPHPKIEYQSFDGFQLDFPDHTFGIVTLAGSWFYARSQQLLDEIARVTAAEGLVIVYDFALSLEPVLNSLGIPWPREEAEYDHRVDFGNYDNSGLQLREQSEDRLVIQLSDQQLAHLLLSVRSTYHFLKINKAVADPFEWLTSVLQRPINEHLPAIRANLFWTVYRKSGADYYRK